MRLSAVPSGRRRVSPAGLQTPSPAAEEDHAAGGSGRRRAARHQDLLTSDAPSADEGPSVLCLEATTLSRTFNVSNHLKTASPD